MKDQTSTFKQHLLSFFKVLVFLLLLISFLDILLSSMMSSIVISEFFYYPYYTGFSLTVSIFAIFYALHIIPAETKNSYRWITGVLVTFAVIAFLFIDLVSPPGQISPSNFIGLIAVVLSILLSLVRLAHDPQFRKNLLWGLKPSKSIFYYLLIIIICLGGFGYYRYISIECFTNADCTPEYNNVDCSTPGEACPGIKYHPPCFQGKCQTPQNLEEWMEFCHNGGTLPSDLGSKCYHHAATEALKDSSQFKNNEKKWDQAFKICDKYARSEDDCKSRVCSFYQLSEKEANECKESIKSQESK